ncbi:GRB10-interacting GYF protein 1 isoform X3 [Salminus brasiliensis]|uniref:GRB10-interacting GYF protein 1 isoform X3 n=1 Tax=Salminus brasiliensis TaxID=930266 RepID=UPI003B82C8DF
MTAETLNFGPEWLRALSRGGSVTSPPPSPAMPKSKLAEYRYGREEMLALYIKDNKVPEDMQDKEFAAILQEEPQQPLALVPLTEEEQRNFSMSVNSVAVLRLMGKGSGAPPAGVSRGRGSTRGGRGPVGRGRGEGGFYQRAGDEELGFGRSREVHRSQSWDDRGERRFEKPIRREAGRGGFEDGGSGRKDYTRADSDNWRTLREEQEEDGGELGGSWRIAGVRRDDGGPRSAGWRDHGNGESRRRKFDFDFRDGDVSRRRTGSEGGEEDRDGLPEWCTDEEEGEMGTFDSTGAFMCVKKTSRDAIPEDQELEFEALEEEEEAGLERKDSTSEKAEDAETGGVSEGGDVKASSPAASAPAPTRLLEQEIPLFPVTLPLKTSLQPSEDAAPVGGSTQPSQNSSSAVASSPPTAVVELPPPAGDAEEEDGMKHLQQEAEKMVASLQDTSLEEECFTQALQESHSAAAHNHTHPAAHTHAHPATHSLSRSSSALALTHESAMKWFYKDPQGEIQGPFSPVEMCEWFQAGYFTMTLLVKRGCDEGFQPLGDVIKMWGRVPFSPGPSPPPLLGNMDQEFLKKQLEQAATAALYQQLHVRFQHLNRSVSVPEAGPMWDMHTSSTQPPGSEAGLWDLTMSNSPQGPTLEQLQKLQQERREAELRAKREEEERKRREEKRRQQEEQKRREEEELYRRKQCRQQQELQLLTKLLQQSQQQQAAQGGSGWSSSQQGPLSLGKAQGKNLGLLELEAERLHKQQQQRAQQQQRLAMNQWSDGSVGMWTGSGLEGKGSSASMGGMWDEAVKNQTNHRNMGMKTSHSSPSLSEQYMLNRRKRTEEEERLLKLLQGMKPQDGFTTWCEQMLHALSASTNNSSSLDVATIVTYLKEVESPYEVHDFIRSYLGDTVEAKEFAKQFLERRAKQKANHQRQQQQLSKEVAGLNMNFPLQSMFQAAHVSKSSSMYDSQGGKMKKKPSMMLHSDPSILGYSFLGSGERMMLGELETVEDY